MGRKKLGRSARLTVRLTEELHDQLIQTAETLGLDAAGLLTLIARENYWKYKARAGWTLWMNAMHDVHEQRIPSEGVHRLGRIRQHSENVMRYTLEQERAALEKDAADFERREKEFNDLIRESERIDNMPNDEFARTSVEDTKLLSEKWDRMKEAGDATTEEWERMKAARNAAPVPSPKKKKKGGEK